MKKFNIKKVSLAAAALGLAAGGASLLAINQANASLKRNRVKAITQNKIKVIQVLQVLIFLKKMQLISFMKSMAQNQLRRLN